MTVSEGSITVRVRIGGEEYPVKGDASVEYIRTLACVVDSRMKDIHQKNPNLNRQRIAVLVALNLADEIEKVRAEYRELLQIVEEANQTR